ncbi:MAG: tetratricopeptide repeat protein [Caulobacterales bacterium]
MFFLGGGLSLLMSVLLCIHVVRTNQAIYWLFIILFLQPLGGIVYLAAIVLPEMFGGTGARRLGQAARETLDPTREYRTAKAAVDDSPTVHNQMRLAQAAAALGKHAEAEALFAQAAQGIHADDPALLLGRANALIELGRHAEALALLEKLAEDKGRVRTPPEALALGRACEGLGRLSEADSAYQFAAGRLPGLEGIARYAAFLARTGRRAEAADAIAEMDRRVAKANPQFRREGRAWRDLAAQALG